MLSVVIYIVLLSALVIWVQGPFFLPTNSLIIKPRPEDQLDDWLKKFSWQSRHEISAHGALPSYKFYTEIVELLLGLARRLGGNYQDSLLFLREGLQYDRQSEKKMREMVLGCWLQMLMLMGLTWAFIVAALSMVDMVVPPGKLIMIATWQAIGLAALPFLLSYFRRRLFGELGRLWRILYVLMSLARVPLSRTEIFSHAGVQELKSFKQKSISHLIEKAKDICGRALRQGGSYEDEVRYLMEELRFQEKWHFELFEKRVLVIKLVVLSVFLLPAYLAFVFLLLGDLMALM